MERTNPPPRPPAHRPRAAIALAVVGVVYLLAAAPSQAVVVQSPPTPLAGFAVAVDPQSGGGGGAVGQCDALLITCAAAAADAGGACFQGKAAIAVLPDPNFQVCATWGVAAAASMSRLVVQSSETAFAKVTSHFADKEIPRKSCEFAGYVHDYVREECTYWVEYVPVDPVVDSQACSQTHNWTVPPTVPPNLGQIAQINTCARSAHRLGNAMCHDAEASAAGETTGFASEASFATSSCDRNESQKRAQDLVAGFGDSSQWNLLKSVLEYVPTHPEVPSLPKLLEQSTPEFDPHYYEVKVGDLDPTDQEILYQVLPEQFQKHLEILSKAFEGSDELGALGDALLKDMEDQFNEALSSRDLVVLVFPESQT